MRLGRGEKRSGYTYPKIGESNGKETDNDTETANLVVA